MNLIIGGHVSFSKEEQLLGSVKEALSYGCNTFMCYTGAPQNTNRVPINDKATALARDLMKKSEINYRDIVVHAPYIINIANGVNKDTYYFSIKFLQAEIKRCEQLGINKIVVHPGSHVGQGYEKGMENIIKALNMIINKEQKVMICLEIMSGRGSECGCNFEQLKHIIDGVTYQDKVGVCLDTCHMHDGGYDLSNFDKVLTEFDNMIGLNKLAVIHINDSKNERGSKKDRHANIGFGNIGFENLINIMYHPKLKDVPKILETPYVDDSLKNIVYPPYKFEIAMIKKKKFNQSLYNDIRMYYQSKES
ncbi:MAG: deoxyribonuclease IV [Bacilli bacterium]|jgi:deoxyribonuclease-4|nr:deoxyribonuclease IV [Bacilli bacterium]